jgi:hypothetical protein
MVILFFRKSNLTLHTSSYTIKYIGLPYVVLNQKSGPWVYRTHGLISSCFRSRNADHVICSDNFNRRITSIRYSSSPEAFSISERDVFPSWTGSGICGFPCSTRTARPNSLPAEFICVRKVSSVTIESDSCMSCLLFVPYRNISKTQRLPPLRRKGLLRRVLFGFLLGTAFAQGDALAGDHHRDDEPLVVVGA